MKSVMLVLAVGAIAIGAQSSGPSLALLTIPQDRLPKDCQLKPVTPRDKPATQVGTTRVMTGPPLVGVPYPSNPWSGTETRWLVETRKKIDKPPSYFVDAPPAQVKGDETQWVQHVVEAYHAIYDVAGTSFLEVSAVKFDDPKLASPSKSVTSEMLIPSDVGYRIVKGNVAVGLVGDETSYCFKALDAYVRGLR